VADEDVPSPIDFHDPVQARKWEQETIVNRPWRPAFFAAFVSALNARFTRPFSVLELGSGPGHLAEAILSGCRVAHYAALDFSEAMHDLARERLKTDLSRVEFITRDFRTSDWPQGLGPFDALVTIQAAHELRHKRHLPNFLKRARGLLAPDGSFLYCDHYAEELAWKHPALYLHPKEQPLALERAGFTRIARLLDKGGMALFSAA
jgi:SAM-dependent methyltransferase